MCKISKNHLNSRLRQNKGGSVVSKASSATMNVVMWSNRAAGPGKGQ